MLKSWTQTKVAKNSGWMIAEQLIRLACGIYVSALMARHLGPAGLGSLSFALAYCSLFGIIATGGLNRILVREVAKHESDPEVGRRLVATVFRIRLAISAMTFALALAVAAVTHQPGYLLIAILSTSFFFGAADVVDLYFQAHAVSRHVVILRIAVLIAGVAIRQLLVFLSADVTAFAVAALLEYLMIAIGLVMLYEGKNSLLDAKHFDRHTAITLLRESWPEIFAGFSVLVFMRLDQVMLANMTGIDSVGIYSAATRLSESWYFVPGAIVASSFPLLVQLREARSPLYLLRFETLTKGLVLLSYLAIAAIWLLGEYAIEIIFGHEYRNAGPILMVHTVSGLFVSLGIASGSWLMAEGKGSLNLYRTAMGAALNILLNLALIPVHGALGAAYATLFSTFFAYFLFDFIHSGARSIAFIKLRSLLLIPVRPSRAPQNG